MTITDINGKARSANSFGYYRFTDIKAGESYIVSVKARNQTFAESTIFLTVQDSISDVNFTAEPRGRP